ncbi:MAG: CocE/NonD family hydrolase [Bryobacterales bacterium]|nr:CocE/NonD family hydrolase [Bryobacterales bacterium]
MLPRIASLALFAALPALFAQSNAPFETASLRNVMIASRDGVKLAANVHLPARNGTLAPGRFPAIVERSPYNKDAVPAALINQYVAQGYAVVIQDVRGRYASEGTWRPVRDDGADGVDLLKWIGQQPWSNGKVGTMGTSYNGSTQLAMAIANAPHLTAMVPVDAMSNYGRYGIRHNGAFELRWFNWLLTLGNATGTRAGATGLTQSADSRAAALRAASSPHAVAALEELGAQVRDYVKALPLRPGATPLKFAPDYEAWLIEAMRHGDNDSFWTDMGSSVVDHIAEYKDVPAYHVTGWYDSWGTQVANLNYVQLSKAKKSLQKLIIGPWTHGGQGISYSGIAEFGPESAIDLAALRLRWYDRWLKGIENGIDKEAPVRLFVMGAGEPHKTADGRLFVGGRWRDEREWPLARAVETPYYLHADGTLSANKPGATPPTTYRFDPANPVPTIGGNVSSEGVLMLRGAQDQRCSPQHWLCKDSLPLSARPDVLVFQTPPLERDIEVTGRLIVKLWASSDGPDTDFTAKLIDVYPPSRDYPAGVDLNIGDSIVRARYRESLTSAKMLKPGEPQEFTIEMYPTSLVFRRGHRIRVDISSSNFPRFDVNPNTGEPLNQQRRLRIAENTIYHDAQHPSRILLPVVP